MATAVIMPRQGQSVESCIIGEWFKKVGDPVQEGDILFSYETDKSSFEEPAKQAGTLLAIFYGADDDVPCLTTVAVIGEPGESYAEFAPDQAAGAEEAPAAEAPAVEAPAAAAAVAAAPAAQAEGTALRGVSPRARNAAERLHVDPAQAQPTGPNGRVIERDIKALAQAGRTGTGLGGRVTAADQAAAAAAPAAQAAPAVQGADTEYQDVKLPNIRKVIAKSMFQSLSTMAQLTHTTSFDATCIMNFRKGLKAAPAQLQVPNITLNDIILFAASRVLPKHPDLNAHFLEDKMRYFRHVNLGIAVDTPRGLMVPTLMRAEEKSLKQIAAEAKALAAACQDGSINPDLLQGASFTVSNLGTLGIEHFTPVINPPQTGILGVDCIVERVRTVDGQITVYPAMGLSLTYDHRALDGAPASRFLQDMRAALENFQALLIG